MVRGRFSLPGQSGQIDGQASQYRSPPLKRHSARARRRFFRLERQSLHHVTELERLEERVEVEQGRYVLRRWRDRLAGCIAHALPVEDRAHGDGLGKGERPDLI
jgi:hypothetical protein